ncbi:MAG: hypothetical protein LBR76_01715 [Oscillospiraceae bacterium]|jgi:hypothetical protein|nr:hypothetical protein [Oscillospiraceae bacterium]
MTPLEQMRVWLKTFPGGIPGNFQVDYTGEIPQNAGLFPAGTTEVSRERSVSGRVTVTNRLEFALYAVFEKPVDAPAISAENAEWVMELQRWVQEQSALGLAPVFGNVNTRAETITAQNGAFHSKKDNGAGVYAVTVTAQFQLAMGAAGRDVPGIP